MKQTQPAATETEAEGERASADAERTKRLRRALNARPSSQAPKSARRDAQKTQRADPRKK